VIRGTGELCARLAQLHDDSAPLAASLDRFLDDTAPSPNGVFRLGLVGLGASFLEAVKIIHGLLERDIAGAAGDLRTRRGRRLELVLFDGHLGGDLSPTEALCAAIRNYQRFLHGMPGSGPHFSETAVEACKLGERNRIEDLIGTGQLSVVPRRLEWSAVRCNEGRLVVHEGGGGTEIFSVLVDCSPFIEGLSPAQVALLSECSAIQVQPDDSGVWRATHADPSFRRSIALVGAAFAPKERWAVGAINAQIEAAIDDLFPPRGTGAI